MRSDNANIHLLTLNVQGVRDRNKQRRVYEWSKQQKASILFLQETHLTDDTFQTFDNQFKGTVVHSFGTSNSRGIAILIHSSICHNVLNFYRDTYGRLLIVNVEIDQVTYSLVNIYAPNYQGDRNIFFKQLLEKISQHAQGLILWAGDFNEILDPKFDRRNRTKIPKKTKASTSLCNIIKENSLVDVWRIKNKQKMQFTWKRQALNEASRIDYFLIPTDLLTSVVSSDIRPAQISRTSHLAVSLKLKIGQQNRGSGLWKINNSVLQDNDYRLLITRIIENTKLTSENSNYTAQNVWEQIKVDVREATQSFSKLKAKQTQNRCTLLENRLKTLHQAQDENMAINENLKTDILNTEQELDSIYEYRAKGAQIRARAEWIEQGEKFRNSF